MKIAIIFNSDFTSWPMGGMITYINSIIKMLQTEYEIDLWGCKIDGAEPQTILVNGKEYMIKTNSAAKTKKKIIPNVVRCFGGNMLSAKKLNEQNYDVLYFHLSASALGWMIGNTLQIKKNLRRPVVILHQHGMAYRNKIGNRLNYWVMNHSDMVFFTTDKDSLKRHLTKIRNSNVVYMPSPVDTTFFHPVSKSEKNELRKQWGIPTDSTVFVFSGRITEWKNPILLSEAFKLYQESNNSNCRLIYIGTGNCMKDLLQHIKALGISDKVIIAGQRPRTELLQFLQLSDVFILPSKGEGVSVAAIEAMSVNLPVLAFNVEGMVGLIKREAGDLVSEQTADALAKGMENIVNGITRYSPRIIALEYDEKKVREMIMTRINSLVKEKEH